MLGLRYSSMISSPDEPAFQHCMQQRLRSDRVRGLDAAREQILDLWKSAVTAWVQRAEYVHVGIELHSVSDAYSWARKCVRVQNILVNVTQLCELVFESSS